MGRWPALGPLSRGRLEKDTCAVGERLRYLGFRRLRRRNIEFKRVHRGYTATLRGKLRGRLRTYGK
eukprot:scaffold33490_cov129-Isochrysis_galbana.AAC.1